MRIQQLLRRPGVTGGGGIIRQASRTRRPLDVLANGQVLHCSDRQSNQHRHKSETEPRERGVARKLHAVHACEGEKQWVRAASEKQVLKELRVRAQHAKADDQRESSPAPGPSLPDAAIEHPQSEREQRADEELSVVARRYVRRNRPAHHARKPADERAVEAVADRAQESVREESR